MSFRLGNGLERVQPEEAQTIAIAGMGGETIAAILSAAPWCRLGERTLLLQPMSGLPELRAWLQRGGYRIVRERLCREGDAIYTILHVTAGETPPLTPAERWGRFPGGRRGRPAAPGSAGAPAGPGGAGPRRHLPLGAPGGHPLENRAGVRPGGTHHHAKGVEAR